MRARRCIWTVLACAVVVLPSSVPAQIAATPVGPAPVSPGPLTRYRFHLAAVHLSTDEPQFRWDADVGGDVDLLDYRTGRLSFLSNYEVILGDERRAFDPVQGNYTLDLSASYRTPHGELFGVFHHVSRHLSDRAKPDAIDWNMAGVRFMRAYSGGRLSATGSAAALWTVNRSTVDYDAEYGLDSRAVYDLGGRVSAFAGGSLHLFATDESVAGRGRQTGGRVEGGFRLTGVAATVEFVAAVERRIDYDPLRLAGRSWASVGFRLLHP
jgi:hypothetical protein